MLGGWVVCHQIGGGTIIPLLSGPYPYQDNGNKTELFCVQFWPNVGPCGLVQSQFGPIIGYLGLLVV